MKKRLFWKGLVLGIIVLFVGAGISSVTSVNIEQKNYPLREDKTAWWKFDEGSGNTAYDSSGHGYDGTVYGATWTTIGLSFDGLDDFVDFDAHATAIGINRTDDFIVKIRFRSTGNGMLYSMSDTDSKESTIKSWFNLYIHHTGKIIVKMGEIGKEISIPSSSTVNDGDWHLVEFYFEGGIASQTLRLLVDGGYPNEATMWFRTMLDEDFLTVKVGRDSNEESDYLSGEIDDVKIYKNLIPVNEPPTPPDIDGPDRGSPETIYEYGFTSFDPESNNIAEYIVKWGDETGEETIFGPFGSGVKVFASHSWNENGTYTIEAKAKDVYGAESNWSQFEVKIPRTRATSYLWYHWFLERFPLLEKLLSSLL